MGSQMLSAQKGQVCLIEDHADLRSDLARLLRVSGYAVDEFESAQTLLQFDLSEFSGVIVSDMVMSGMSGLDCQSELSSRGMTPPFIFISGESSSKQIISAMKNHTSDFLLKPFTKHELLDALEKAMAYALASKKEYAERKEFERNLDLLSPREKEVFFLLAQGFSNQELVSALSISLATAKQYKSEVMRKMRIKTLSQLLAMAKC